MRNCMVGSWVIAIGLFGCGGSSHEPAGPLASASASAAPKASASASAPPPAASSAAPVAPPPPVSLKDAATNWVSVSVAGFHSHDSKAIGDLYARDAIIANPGPGGMEDTTPLSMRKDLDALFAAFPDAQFSAVRVLGRGNIAIVEWIISGTNQGDFMGHRPSSKSIGYHGASVLMFSDAGLVKHETMYFDMGTVLTQLGLGPKNSKARFAERGSSSPPEMIFADPDDTAAVDYIPALKAYYAATDRHDDKAVTAMIAESVTSVPYYMASDQKKADIVKSIKDSAKAFPDAKTDTVACWSVGHWAACETIWGATFKGPSMGMKPTQKAGQVHSIDLVRFDGMKMIDQAESFANGSEFAASFGIGGDKKNEAESVTLTGNKPQQKPANPPPPKK